MELLFFTLYFVKCKKGGRNKVYTLFYIFFENV